MKIEAIKKRSVIIKEIRSWFDRRGFLEMQTPRLVGVPGQEPYLDPFWTETLDEKGECFPSALITSPEYAMKRLLAEGLDRIYDLGPCFRNGETWDGTHEPEFWMLEWYRRNAGTDQLMQDAEELVREVAKKIPQNALHLSQKPFVRMTVAEAWKKYADVDLESCLENREALAKIAEQFNQTVAPEDTWDDIYFKIFLSVIEPHFAKEEAVFLYRYPASMAALARRDAEDPRWAERVELSVRGVELANGFAELCDPAEQRERFKEERALRASLGKKTWEIDEDLLSALPRMGPAAGMALGADRLAMLIIGAPALKEILPFPAGERLDRK